MTVTPFVGNGTTLSVSADNSTFTVLAGLVDGLDGESTFDVIDTTLSANLIKTSLPGKMDPGTATFIVACDPNDAGSSTTLLDAVYGRNAYAGVVPYWKITYPITGTNTRSFRGFVSSIGTTVTQSAMTVHKLTIQLTGDPNVT